MRVIIIGPMTGKPDFNYHLFNANARRLRATDHRWTVVNPAENFDGDQSLPWHVYIGETLRQIQTCTHYVLLPGWEDSFGARIEVITCEKFGLVELDYLTLEVVDKIPPVDDSVNIPDRVKSRSSDADLQGDRPQSATIGQEVPPNGYSFVPALAALNRVLFGHGARKHGDAWKKRKDIEDIEHIWHHIHLHDMGDIIDADSGEHPMIHAAARAIIVAARAGHE